MVTFVIAMVYVAVAGCVLAFDWMIRILHARNYKDDVNSTQKCQEMHLMHQLAFSNNVLTNN
jgi:hypothetical protein